MTTPADRSTRFCATSDSPDSLYFDLIAKKLCSPAITASHHEHLGTYTGIAFDTRDLSDLVSDAVSHVVERAAAKILAANERFRASLDPPLNDSHGWYVLLSACGGTTNSARL